MEDRVLIWAHGRDGRLTARFLAEAGFDALPAGGCGELCRELARGAGALILAEEVLSDPESGTLRAVLNGQPAWSDIPVIIIAGTRERHLSPRHFAELTSVSVLHRPLSLDTLCSTVGVALKARRRQYQVRDLLEQREESTRRRDEFVAMMAHELRNPLAPIRTGLQLLQVTESPEQASRLRAMMERQLKNMSRLIDDLLDVSRITRGKIELKREILDAAAMLRDAANARRSSAAEKGLRLEVMDPPDGPVLVHADPVRLEQMINNLLSNAIKFTPAPGTITLGARRAAGEAVLSVQDTGIGIPPRMLGTIFELFAQTDRGLDRSQGGLGIGLSIVKMLAELHGGRVEAHSAGDGKGALFIIRLPAVDAKAGERPAGRLRHDELAERPRRVLIVEDNRDAADSLAEFLRLRGHSVTVEYDSRGGLAAVEREHPEVVICDIGLPGMDGYQLARAIRGSGRFDGHLLIAVTGYGDPRDRERGIQAGFDHYLVKPADVEVIANLMRACGGDGAR
ncbi:MAG TPA: ATP-binding protein [Steroidobacteraceae bacterium]|nr:ATP-binding protein [Steroidobacteraceae bacterium]